MPTESLGNARRIIHVSSCTPGKVRQWPYIKERENDQDCTQFGAGVVIGAACRFFDIPVPGPPKLVSALLVVAMTVGYSVLRVFVGSLEHERDCDAQDRARACSIVSVHSC